ncbi:MAG TPA: helicase [Planctomycetaceae bacterium]|nr:helicase [Planctomycetaceae bacterium]
MALQSNPQLELAADYVRNTNKHLFLTGKAGSGKTTFLHQVKAEGLKRMAVVAPTGVAAINAGGMTIHSLFQIPPGLHLPELSRNDPAKQPHLRAQKIRLIRSLDLLVIDEISMVRADLLDAGDQALQKVRGSHRPFGGVQLLMIGDLHQLPPVVKQDEVDLLRKHYDTFYFFGSRALSQTDYLSIELKHIYRQADPEFISLLNSVRDNRMDDQVLQKLNRRWQPNFQPAAGTPYITLTATNAAANELNQQNLERLQGQKYSFQAQVTGDFPASSFPTEQVLELKVGTQVMFIKNDVTPSKAYYNRKLGRVSSIDDEGIWVTCDDSRMIFVAQAEWQNVKYELNEETKKIDEKVIGLFVQYPLRLAWAITIHKSQGLTFERCIIDAQAAFATGQVYVALSRCKSLEGIVLRTPINLGCVKTDPVVQRFSETADRNLPTAAQLLDAKREYQAAKLQDLFRFSSILEAFESLQHLCATHSNSVLPETKSQCDAMEARADSELRQVSEKFAPQLGQYLTEDLLPENNAVLQGRVQKAAGYFMERLDGIAKEMATLSTVTDNQEVADRFDKAVESLLLALAVKRACFAACQKGFSTELVNRAQIDAELEFEKKLSSTSLRTLVVPKGMPNPELYRQLLYWREETARDNNVKPYEVVPNITLREIVVRLPANRATLLELPGIGKGRARRYGHDLLRIIQDYCQERELTTHSSQVQDDSSQASTAKRPEKAKSKAPDTKRISYNLFRLGKSVQEIAIQRERVPGTILGHLAHFVKSGELDVAELLEPSKVEEIKRYLIQHSDATAAQAISHFGGKYDYGELKLVISHIEFEKSCQPPQGSDADSAQT